MNFGSFKLKSKVMFMGVVTMFAFACGNDTDKPVETGDDLPDNDTVKTAVLNVGGELFSIPSPLQTAILIQKVGAPYDKNALNPANKNGQYSSEYLKALNLGIYGADLGYVTLYNQTQDAIGYMGAVKQLADKLGVSAAFSPETMKRIETNIANKDSLLSLVSVAYRASDAYLKNNQRMDVSSLIITGGWIESMNFSLNAYSKKQSDEIKFRIAQQKQALTSIVKLLKAINKPETTDLITQLDDLLKVFDGITYKYTFVEPTTDTIKKVTYINSTTEVSISKEQLDKIASKIAAIREKITNVQS